MSKNIDQKDILPGKITMPPTSFNHMVSTLVDRHLITDSPISRAGREGSATTIQIFTLTPGHDTPHATFPMHMRLMSPVVYGTSPHEVITYGLLPNNCLGVVVAVNDGKHALYITAECDKLSDAAYRAAIERSLLRVAAAGRLEVPYAALVTLMQLFSLPMTPQVM